MGGRGSFAAGNPVPYKYKTVGFIEGVKVLEGTGNNRGLPESSHSSCTAYIKLDYKGVFKEMRFYKDHVLFLEIGYHSEKTLGSPNKSILHYHLYHPLFSKTKTGHKYRSDAIKLPGGWKKKLRKYFKGVKL